MDLTDNASLDVEVSLESFSRDVQDEEILRGTDAVGYGSGVRTGRLCTESSVLFALSIFLLAVIAFSGATHDVATDGVYMSELNKQEQAKYIGWQGAFYNIAKIVASGGLVWLAGWLLKYFGGVPGATDAVRHEATVQAWMCVMLVMAAVMILLAIYHWRMLPSGGAAAAETKSAAETLEKLRSVIGGFLSETSYRVLYCLYHSLSPCRGFRHEDCSPFLEGGTFGRRLGTE